VNTSKRGKCNSQVEPLETLQGYTVPALVHARDCAFPIALRCQQAPAATGVTGSPTDSLQSAWMPWHAG
jgi:hypothetical protein